MCGMCTGLSVDLGQTDSMLGYSIWGQDSQGFCRFPGLLRADQPEKAACVRVNTLVHFVHAQTTNIT